MTKKDKVKHPVVTAILIDGGFYRRRANTLFGSHDPKISAEILVNYCNKFCSYYNSSLYRIFYYDCMPISKKVYHPLLNKTVDLSKSDLYTWTTEFFNELQKKRKVALRLGSLSEEHAHFDLRYEVMKKLVKGVPYVLCDKDFTLKVEQKGVDMKIGVDISSLAYKKQVNQIVLISGDSDFAPVAKLARIEGIDFILDPMWQNFKDDLNKHVDGIHSCCSKDPLSNKKFIDNIVGKTII